MASTAQQTRPSALEDHLAQGLAPASPHSELLQHLALQVKHNLQHQHNWTSLCIHHYAQGNGPRKALRRPMISGLPPNRLYIHPDEQIAMLQAAKKAAGPVSAADEAAVTLAAMTKVPPQREWVLPSHLNEKWTLREFGQAFDDIGIVPPSAAGGGDGDDLAGPLASGPDKTANPWQTTKRVLLATVDGDSTVVYYIVHDGIVKPRQN